MGGANLTVSSAHRRPKIKNLVLVAAYSSSLRIPYPLSRFSCSSSASGLLRPGQWHERSKVERPHEQIGDIGEMRT